MKQDYDREDYQAVKDLQKYQHNLEDRLRFFEDTSTITIPEDPIEKVVFQDKAKKAIRQVAVNKGDMLMVGKPGTGKSLLAEMFSKVLDGSLGDYLRPKKAIVALPGKDENHIVISYTSPESIDNFISNVNKRVQEAKASGSEFSLGDPKNSFKKAKNYLAGAAGISFLTGLVFPPAFAAAGIAGIGSIFCYIQQKNAEMQEITYREIYGKKQFNLKPVKDITPVILFDPRKQQGLMTRISEPSERSMKGGFKHDPYQSGNLQTPAHKRAYLGAHAKAPILYIDELKTLVNNGYMADLLELMQEKKYILESGKNTGSGASDRSENEVRAENIIIACCNHDTLGYLKKAGDGAFLSRIEGKGAIIEMESAVPETPENTRQAVQYIKQELVKLENEINENWGEILEKEGKQSVKKRSEKILGRSLPDGYDLNIRQLSKPAVMEIIKELRCRASDKKLSAMLRPINRIISASQYEAIIDCAELVEPKHIREAFANHQSLEGSLTEDSRKYTKDLKMYLDSMHGEDCIGYVVGLAVIGSNSSGQMFGTPLPIRCQIDLGADKIDLPGKIGDSAIGAAKNVRASIKHACRKTECNYPGYEMHVQYVQAHGGVDGDSASISMDVGLISDFIQQPVNQKYGITGSLTGEIVLAVGGVTEKVRSIMDKYLGMEGVCIPWQNKHDIEALLVNQESEFIQNDEIPGLRIYRTEGRTDPFDVYFCKGKYNAYKIMMGLGKEEVEKRMADRSQADFKIMQEMRKK